MTSSSASGGGSRRSVSSGSPYEPVIGFSRAVRIGNAIHVSGTGPVFPDDLLPEGGFPVDDPYAQTRRAFEIALAAVADLGGSVNDVVRTRMFLTRAEDWEEVGRAHGWFFGDIRPASTMVVVATLLDPTWRIEIEVDAVVPD
jgi:enamine deaminase RidA (YjgF/YER057c/UK114 family)